MKRLQDKVALVTGAAAGLGKAIAELYANEGAKVVAADISEAGLKAVADEIIRSGGTIITVVADMAKAADIENMIAMAVKEYGTIDILVNNAGIMDDFSPAGTVKDEMWAKVMEINLTGPFKAMRSALSIMLAKGSGIIINIASIGGLQGARAGAAYTASKHALIGLTKNTGYLYAKSGIRCNAIAPGAMETNIAATIDLKNLHPLVNERIMPGMVLNPRSSKPVEMAEVALFLASEASGFVNGAVITADGGWTAY